MVGEVRPGQGESPEESEVLRPVPAAEPVQGRSVLGAIAILGLLAVAVFGGLCGLLGYRLIEARKAEKFQDELVEAARQGAVNLTTIDYQHADADVQRVLDSATGAFYDDFKAKAAKFADVAKKVKSTSVGTVTAAGFVPESVFGTRGQVLVAVTVTTTNDGIPDEQPQHWRMRMTVTKEGTQAKVSTVEFVP